MRTTKITTAPSATSLPTNIGLNCTYEELFVAFNLFTSGSPRPENVIIDVNPYRYKPQNLPGGFWYLINSNENPDVEHGLWKKIEETCDVFSNSEIIGWRTTYEYYEGQHRTEWVMQVFSITAEDERKETSSLCKIFPVPSHEMQQKVSSAGNDTENRNHLTRFLVPDAHSSTRIGSSSEVNKHDETEVSAPEDLIEMDLFLRSQMELFSGGDFLELKDLDNPASSSSSENSSAVSTSSDERFDSMAFLQELEEPISEQNNAGQNFNVSANNKSDEMFVVPADSDFLVSVDGNHYSSSDESLKTTGATTQADKMAKHVKVEQRHEGPSTSSNSHRTAAGGGRKRAGFGGMRKLGKKYCCFMPF